DLNGVYAVGLRSQVWRRAAFNKGVRQIAQRDAAFLVDALYRSQSGGFYGWAIDPRTHRPVPELLDGEVPNPDPIVGHFGVLGTSALADMTGEISAGYWMAVESAWRSAQRVNGGWPDTARAGEITPPETVAATAAGLATLYLTQEHAHYLDGLQCAGNAADRNIDAGVSWLARNVERLHDEETFRALFVVQNAASGGGHRYFGNVDWQKMVLDHVIWRQNGDGSFGRESPANPRKIPDTAFALMFLARVRMPVIVNKLDYEQFVSGPKSWNERPRDVANITRWVGWQIERPLNWRTVTLRSSLADWQEAPILWVSGRDMLDLANADVPKLKRYIEAGGLVFGNADGGNKAFADSFKELGQLMFPLYRFRELPQSHVIYTGEQFNAKNWRQPVSLEGMSNGIRELMILAPGDFGRSFQAQAFTGSHEAVPQAFANLCLYATDKSGHVPAESLIVPPSNNSPPTRTTRVARLKYAGNWNPEPAGWPRLADHLRRITHDGTGLSVEPIDLGDGTLLTSGMSIAHLTGTDTLQLAPAQLEELRKFVKQGGTLIVDAAGGSTDFAKSAEAALLQLFPDAGGFPILAASHPVYQSGQRIEKFRYRDAAQRVFGRLNVPRLRAAEIDGRARIFFSAEDISAGLVGQHVDGIVGYTPETALGIMSNILLYSSGE
ncbi:MAG: DUF4159 domain-containing protein, partial [Tepidisphaeraceae bacterium]